MMRRFLLALLGILIADVGRAEEGYFDSGGVKIHYRVEGKGEPVLLIHGFAGNIYLQWVQPGIFRTLSRDYRVIALDVRGHGQSGKPTEVDKYGTEMVEDVVRLLDHLKIKKAHIVGYSMGGVITAKLLATHPDRLLSATLGGTGVVTEGVEMPSFVEKLADSLEAGRGLGPLITFLWPPDKPPPSEATVHVISRTLVGDNSKALAAVVRSWKQLNVPKEQLRANKIPMLALIGSKDPFKKSLDRVKDDIANLQVVVIEGTDHSTTYFNPKFIQNLRKFLSEHANSTKPDGDPKEATGP